MAETEAQTAERLGLDRPYVSGPSVGRCPGGAAYGHGMTYTTVHSHGCCQAWAEARALNDLAAEAAEASQPEAGG